MIENFELLPYQKVLAEWNAFRGATEPGESKANIEILMEYQQMIVAAADTMPAEIALPEIANLKQKYAFLIMKDEELRNKYYDALAEHRKLEKKSRKAPSPWEKKFLPNTIDERLTVIGYGKKSKDDPNDPA